MAATKRMRSHATSLISHSRNLAHNPKNQGRNTCWRQLSHPGNWSCTPWRRTNRSPPYLHGEFYLIAISLRVQNIALGERENVRAPLPNIFRACHQWPKAFGSFADGCVLPLLGSYHPKSPKGCLIIAKFKTASLSRRQASPLTSLGSLIFFPVVSETLTQKSPLRPRYTVNGPCRALKPLGSCP